MNAENDDPNLPPQNRKRGKRSAQSLAKRKKKFVERQVGFLKQRTVSLEKDLAMAQKQLKLKVLECSNNFMSSRKRPNNFRSGFNQNRPKRFCPIGCSDRQENHDGRMQRRHSLKVLTPISFFDANNFEMRLERCLGSGSFGQVYACSFGFQGKIKCVIKLPLKGASEELLLEGRILRKILDYPIDWRQKFFPFLYGYWAKKGGLVSERFFGLTVKQHASGKICNKWIDRLLEVSDAISFLHSRQVMHLDIHASNVMATQETSKILDFGKATLSDFPITYNLDAAERELYNKNYKQIEFELRNEKQAKTGFCSDIYSLGVLMDYIAEKCVVSNKLKPRLLLISENCCAPRAIRNSLPLLISDLQELKTEED